jgi:hypothetical protein
MPTGYTHKVQSGEITEFRDFAMQCARAFGATITMRDDPMDAPIPDEFAPSTWHVDKIATARRELDELDGLGMEHCERAADAAYKDAVKYYEESEARRAQENARYDAMRAKVEAWEPPSPDHVEMKSFMLEQLSVSMDRYTSTPPTRLTGAAWLGERVRALQRDIEYHTTENKKEIERAAQRTLWIRQLRESLSSTGPTGEKS